MRRLDYEEFQQDFPEEWEAFLDFYSDDAENVRFIVDEDGLIEARCEGEIVGLKEEEDAEWKEAA